MASKNKGKGRTVLIIAVVLIAFIIIGFSSSSKNSEPADMQSSSAAENTVVSENKRPAASFDTNIVRFDVETNSIGTVELNAIVEIKNTGSTNLYIGTNNKFAVNDSTGHLVASEDMLNECPNIISPGESSYIYTLFSSLPDGTDPSQQFSLDPQLDIEEAQGEGIVDYQVDDIGLSSDSFGDPVVTGRLTNNSDEDISYLYIQAVLTDSSGAVIGIEGTSVTDVASGAHTTFEINALDDYDGKVSDAKIVARKEHYQF